MRIDDLVLAVKCMLAEPYTLEKLFQANVAIVATRAWEAFSLDDEGYLSLSQLWQRVARTRTYIHLAGFPEYPLWCKEEMQERLYDMMREDIDIFFNAINSQTSVKPFSQVLIEKFVVPAREFLIRNHDIVNKIEFLDRSALKLYLEDMRVFEFSGPPCERLRGLSSWDGSIAFISAKALGTAPKIEIRRCLEHEFVHNISRVGNFDPFRISPSKNHNLRLRSDSSIMIEAGNFYEEQVYGKIVMRPSPFCFNLSLA